MISAIIIDDELHCISALKYDLDKFCRDVTVVDTCNNAEEGIASIRRHSPDLVFLDIEMPVMNGLQMLDQLNGQISFQLIFTTAYDKFAARAFRLSAVDYLMKPVDSGDLQEAVQKVKTQLYQNAFKQINNLKYNFSHPLDEQRIALPQRDGYDFVKVTEIMYCRADGAYTMVIFKSERQMLLSRSLGEVAEMLPPELFERIHHSTLVNVRSVKQLIKRDGTHLVMEDGTELSISKSKKDQILMRLARLDNKPKSSN